jgi:hypothetical protein
VTRTPLTLEYSPEAPDEESAEGSAPVIIVEPSFRHPGTIFIGIHPFGKRLGVHLMPADAERVRNHLSKLLMEEGPTPEESAGEGVDWTERIEQAAKRQIAEKRAEKTKKKRRRRRKPLQFRLEFSVGKVQGIIGTPHE